jgi:ribosome-binding ATPase
MKLGIVGLPNVGKSTLFNAITKAGAASANYPFCTIDPNIGVVSVPDQRIDHLSTLYKTKKSTYTSIEFFDIAGLVKGASSGEGLGNKFLSHIREADAIVHVVRCFEDDKIIHVEHGIDPIRDIGIINLELILSDMELLQRRIDKTRKTAKSGEAKQKEELDLYEALYDHLENERPARTFHIDNAERAELLANLFLITSKPVLYAANISERDLSAGESKYVEKVSGLSEKEGSELIVVCARAEEEIAGLNDAEKKEYLEMLGLRESGLDKLVRASYKLLGLISFLTAGEPEVRAWTIKKGTKAPQAAGKIHSDFEKGFIRAEVLAYDALMESGTYIAAKEKGFVRSEGKEYVVKDGDIILFRFNV